MSVMKISFNFKAMGDRFRVEAKSLYGDGWHTPDFPIPEAGAPLR
jgi:hypothetical protein